MNVNVYPNPVTDFATVEFENASGIAHSFSVYDMAGRSVVVINNIYESSLQFERSGLQGGVYIYRLTNENGAVAEGKLILN